jgi:hypothetical protein
MPGLVPGIHALLGRMESVDGRDKPGHDGLLSRSQAFYSAATSFSRISARAAFTALMMF